MIVPDMGYISINPKSLMCFISCGGWIREKTSTFSIYDGTLNGPVNFVEKDLIGTLMIYNFITVDSGNWDLKERFYLFNKDYQINDKNKNTEILEILKKQINNNNYKNKYKHLIRQHKLKRVLKCEKV